MRARILRALIGLALLCPAFAFPPLGRDSVIMLIGDVPAYQVMKSRVDAAASSGVDTVLIVVSTDALEGAGRGDVCGQALPLDYTALDRLIEYAAGKGLSVMLRVVVDSRSFCNRITSWFRPAPNVILTVPAYTDSRQLDRAAGIVEELVRHMDSHPNVTGYQVEWGVWGESTTYAPYWRGPDPDAPNPSDEAFLAALPPEFGSAYAGAVSSHWVYDDLVYHSDALEDERNDPAHVAEFYWYQLWRNETTRSITARLRSAAYEATAETGREAAILGFSYTGARMRISLVYTADASPFLAGAFSDWTPDRYWRPNFTRNAALAPEQIHLGELDFDTPYFANKDGGFDYAVAEEAIAGMYSRGIVPVIFYPAWGWTLKDQDIPVLVEMIRRYRSTALCQGQVLLVAGRDDVAMPRGGNGDSLLGEVPFLSEIQAAGWRADVIDADAYTAEVGRQYGVVVVVVPRDSYYRSAEDPGYQGSLMKRLNETGEGTRIVIVNPSFAIATPTAEFPLETASSHGDTPHVILVGDRPVRIIAAGCNGLGVRPGGLCSGAWQPDVTFFPPLAEGTITGFTPGQMFHTFEGEFDAVLASATLPSRTTGVARPVIARIGNITLFGLDHNIARRQYPNHYKMVRDAFSSLLAEGIAEEDRCPAPGVFYLP